MSSVRRGDCTTLFMLMPPANGYRHSLVRAEPRSEIGNATLTSVPVSDLRLIVPMKLIG